MREEKIAFWLFVASFLICCLITFAMYLHAVGQGREAGRKGMPATSCPYSDDPLHYGWKRGWAETLKEGKE